MKLLTGNDYLEVMLKMSEPNFHLLKEIGCDATWDDVVRFYEEVSQIPLKTEHRMFLEKVECHFGDHMDGIWVMPAIEEEVLDIAKRYNIPMTSGMAAAVLPNNLGMEIIAINLSSMMWHPDVLYLMEHELHHLKQIRRGDLQLGADGNIQWTGWSSSKTLSLVNNLDNYRFNCGDLKTLVHNEITQKPWEAEAYALTLPVSRWCEYFSEATKEYIMSNWHKFNPN